MSLAAVPIPISADLILSILCAATSLFIVFGKTPLYLAFTLLVNILIMGGIYLQLGFPFLGIMQILMAISMIMAFVFSIVVLIGCIQYKFLLPKRNLKPIAGLFLSLILLGIITLIIDQNATYLLIDESEHDAIHFGDLFEKIFNDYFLAFGLASLSIFLGTISFLYPIESKEKGREP